MLVDVEAPMPDDRRVEGSPLSLEQEDTEQGGDVVLDGAIRAASYRGSYS